MATLSEISSCSTTTKSRSPVGLLPIVGILLSLCIGPTVVAQQTGAAADLAELSLEELADIQITSVSRRSENLSEAPAAAYVISRDDIIRTGVTSIPEALRLAPGVEVARRGADSWSITIRGFNSDLSNKLLVLIDGRSVYSPLYAGVFWDVQNVLLEDVERIEVIAGPGGTLWGANAVNGVINIITRSAEDTRGGFIEAGWGNEERGFVGLRYGGQLGEAVSTRAYVKYFDKDASVDETGEKVVDDWNMAQGGFRLDMEAAGQDSFTLQGDAYSGKKDGEFLNSFTLGTLPDGNFEDDVEISGANLLGRWSRDLGVDSSLRLQVYFDYTRRNIPNLYNETRNTIDIDFQHRFNPIDNHNIVWGAGFRLTDDEIDNSVFARFEPDNRTDETFSFFLQDKIDLWDERLFLTLGSKFEHNDYTGFEYQPNARLTWLVNDRQTLWGAVSRAVRIPSRLDTDLRLTAPTELDGIPVYLNVDGSEDFESEGLIAYETGYRFQIRNNLTFDLTAFYNDYDKLQTIEPDVDSFNIVIEPPLIYVTLSSFLENQMYGESYGGTLMTNWQPASYWRLQFQYSYLDLQMHSETDSLGNGAPVNIEGNSPQHQISAHSFIDLPYSLNLYTGLSYVDKLPTQDVDDYIALDISLRWQPIESVEVSLTGRNLTDKHHQEFGGTGRIERSIYGKISWRF